MTWQPDQAGVHQIAGLLSEFQRAGADQPGVLAQLEQCRAIPYFDNYLAYIFVSSEALPLEVRQSAGLLLKNNLRLPVHPPGMHLQPSQPENDSYVRAAVLHALKLPERALRHTAGTCVVALVGGRGGIAAWPDLPCILAEMLNAPDASAVDGALDTLFKLWEEIPGALEAETPPHSGQRASDVLIPATLAKFDHAVASARALAVGTMNLAVDYMPPALVSNMDAYTSGLFRLATDPDAAIRKTVCAGLVKLVAVAPDRLQPQLPAVIEYMLATTKDGEEDVAVEACEFWSAMPESGLDMGALRPYLPRLLPVLLGHMVWDEYDDEVADAEAAEEEALSGRVPAKERDADIRPHHHVTQHAQRGGISSTGGWDNGDGDYGDGDDDDEEEEVGRWNLRRCSAAGLDMLSTTFGDELLPLLLPTVEARLQDSDWRARESVILALGAVSEGCAGGLAAHLPGIVGAVLIALPDPRPMVRCIACWALARYTRGLLDRAQEGDRSMLDRVVEGLCERILDHNRKVQEAACGSLANLTEEAGASLAAYGPRVLTALGLALTRYGRRSLRSAYDALVTIADYCPAALRGPEAASACLPQLFGKIPTYSDGDKDLLPLLECVGAVTAVTGPHLQPYAEGLFGRYVDMADRLIAGVQSGAYEKEESDEFVVAALDALSGLVEGLGAGAESLIARSSALEVLKHCVADVNPDVRQSAFAVVGEIARACLPRLRPSMQDLVGACLANVEPAAITQPSIGACNNAAWALGEVALQCRPDEAASFALPALERLVRILAAPAGGLPRSLVENAAVALGRIAIVAPEPMAPHAMVFVGPWCSALRGVLDGKEKRDAFLGLCAVLERNPDGGGAAFSVLCESVASWRDLREESSSGLKSKLTELMQRYKTRLLELGQWDAAMSSLSPAVRQKLANMFSL